MSRITNDAFFQLFFEYFIAALVNRQIFFYNLRPESIKKLEYLI